MTQQQRKQIQEIFKHAPPKHEGVKNTLAILIPRLIAAGDNDSIAKMKIKDNQFAVLIQDIRNIIGLHLWKVKGMEKGSPAFNNIIDRLSANIVFHIIRNENFLQQQIQMQGQAAEDLAYYKELISRQQAMKYSQQAIKRMQKIKKVFYPPAPAADADAVAPAPVPVPDQKERDKIMKEIKDCLEKYGVGGGGGGGGP